MSLEATGISSASALAQIKKKSRYRNSMSTESPIVLLTPPNPEEVVREERRLSMDSVHSVDKDKEEDEFLVPPAEPEPEEIVAKLIKQRRPSTITTLSNTIKQIFIEKKMKEDGIPALIIEGLYLGSIGAAKNLQWLKSHGVSHVLCVAGGIGACFPKQFVYHMVEINDAAHEDISSHFGACYQFIEDALTTGGKVLVHCFAGMSRSVTVTAAYLMQKQRIHAVPALKLVKQARTAANPNAGFIVQLIKFENVIGLRKNGNESENRTNKTDHDPTHKAEDDEEKHTETSSASNNNMSIKLNSPMVQEWETGRRPSLFTALAKLRGIKNRSRMSSTDSDNEEKEKPKELGLHPALDNVKLQLLKEVSDETDDNDRTKPQTINIQSLAVDKEEEEEVITPLESLNQTRFPDTIPSDEPVDL
eukprot:135535_1